ncbi:MAG: 16S rRNA (cytidine(1402)-2'-O)-methyltransferase [Candidatus Taylorbacteria bacterium]
MSTFYVIGTPIGNLEDITLRALRILKEVDLILCEDTRVTAKLLKHYGVSTPKESYHEHSKSAKIERIIELVREGKNIALVSDAGTPGISDPGSFLVAKIREACKDEVTIVSVPGPSALTAFLSISGAPTNDFTFLGFLPHKKGRETLFKEMDESSRATVFYESPHRILKTLESLVKMVNKKRVVVGRELTKMYEEIVSGTPSDVLQYFKSQKEKVRGEFVVLVFPSS